MALKVDYKNDILDTSVNDKRKYRMTTNADGTVSLEDVTAYQQTGDTFGAQDINDTNTSILEVNNGNLLVNPFFEVNTRKITNYVAGTKAGEIGINDGWWLSSGNDISFSIVDKKINLSSKSGNYMAQRISMPMDKMLGKTYTISIKADGTTKSGSFTMPEVKPNANTNYGVIQLNSNTYVYIRLYSDGSPVRICIGELVGTTESTSWSISGIEAVKLEMGTDSTLENDVITNYNIERIKCTPSIIITNSDIGEGTSVPYPDGTLIFVYEE